MSVARNIEFSVITPTSGARPKALGLAVDSLAAAIQGSGGTVSPEQVEMLVGYDGIKGPRFEAPFPVRFFNLPLDNDWGNGIRPLLIKAAKGRRLVFLDDDNALTPNALAVYMRHADADLVIARIDTSNAFDDTPFLPRDEDEGSLVRQGNVDPLCICPTRELVLVRCGNWRFKGYPADYRNIIQFHRRAASVAVVKDVVGIYDAGRGLDRQSDTRRRLDHQRGEGG